MPEAVLVTEMTYLDLLSQTGEFFVVAGTYGRGMWKREITGDDPVSGMPVPGAVTQQFQLRQNRPNPFVDATTIELVLPTAEHVTLGIYDVSGRKVQSLADGRHSAGVHRFEMDGRNLVAGVYFCRATAGAYTDMKRITRSH